MTTNDHDEIKRSQKISVRFTPDQFNIIQKLSSNSKRSLSETVRDFCLEAIESRLSGS